MSNLFNGAAKQWWVHVIQILNTLENLDLKKPYGKFEVHAMSSAMMQAFYDRAKYLGDADFVEVPIKGTDRQRLRKEPF